MNISTKQIIKKLPYSEINEIWVSADFTTMEKVVKIITMLNKDYSFKFKELEEITGVDSTYLNKLANGKRKNLTVDYLEKIITSLKIKKK